MIDALIVIGCLVAGYVAGRVHAAFVHARAVDNLGAFLLTLADVPHSEGRLREHVHRLGSRLVNGGKP